MARARRRCRGILRGQCDLPEAADGSRGSGEWTCTLRWITPERQPLRDVYDLFVTPDGCYAATVEGESLGAPTITAPDGRRVRNLLYAFEGCFDKD